MPTIACSLLLMASLAGPATAQSDDAPGPIPEDAPATEETPVTPPAPAVETKAPAAAATASEAPVARSRAADDLEPTWYDDLAFNAFISAAAVHNFAVQSPLAGANATRLFDRDNDTLKVDVAQLVLQDEATAPGDVGFRIDLVHGLSVPVVLGGNDIALQQAFVSYLAPVGDGLRLDVGTFMSHIGSETIENHENFNDTYSRGFLFTLGLPPLLTGVRARYAVGNAFTAEVLAVNGWRPNVIDINTGKTVGVQLAYTPVPEVSLRGSYLAGPEKPADNADWRHLVDIVATLRATAVTVTLEAMAGHESDRTASAAKTWLGALASLRWDIWGPWAVALRGEYFDDSQGFASIKTRLWELSLAPSFKVADGMTLRAELRHDHALDLPVYSSAHDFVAYQTTAALNLLFVF